MKRKLNKKKLYQIIRQAGVIISFNIGMSAMMIAGFIQNTIY